MTQLSKAVVMAFSSKSGIIIFGGIKPLLETGFSHEIYSTCDGLSFQQSVYNALGLLFPCHTFPSPQGDRFAVCLQ